MSKILHGQSIGEKKTEIAKRLGISPGRLSQLLETLGKEIAEFFGPENLPDSIQMN